MYIFLYFLVFFPFMQFFLSDLHALFVKDERPESGRKQLTPAKWHLTANIYRTAWAYLQQKKWGIRSEFLRATLSQKLTFEQKYMASYMAIGAVHAHQVVVAWWIWQWNGSFFNSCYWVRVSVTKSEYGINFPSFRLKAWLLRAHVS